MVRRSQMTGFGRKRRLARTDLDIAREKAIQQQEEKLKERLKQQQTQELQQDIEQTETNFINKIKGFSTYKGSSASFGKRLFSKSPQYQTAFLKGVGAIPIPFFTGTYKELDPETLTVITRESKFIRSSEGRNIPITETKEISRVKLEIPTEKALEALKEQAKDWQFAGNYSVDIAKGQRQKILEEIAKYGKTETAIKQQAEKEGKSVEAVKLALQKKRIEPTPKEIQLANLRSQELRRAFNRALPRGQRINMTEWNKINRLIKSSGNIGRLSISGVLNAKNKVAIIRGMRRRAQGFFIAKEIRKREEFKNIAERKERLFGQELLNTLKKEGSITFVTGKTQLRDIKTGRLIRTVREGLGIEVTPRILPQRTTKDLIKDLKKNTGINFSGKSVKQIGKEFSGGFLEFPLSVIKGFVRAITHNFKPKIRPHESIITGLLIKSRLQGGLSVQDKKRLEIERKGLKKLQQEDKELFNDPDVQLFLFVASAALIAPTLLAVGGTTAIITGVTLGLINVGAIGIQGLNTIKNPTPKNFGTLTFFMVPTGIGILKGLGKLRSNFRPSVKNVAKMDILLSQKKKSNLKLLNDAIKLEEEGVIKKLKEQNKKIDQARKEIRWLKENKEILKTRDFNPTVHNNAFRKIQNSYRSGIHVSATSPRKLFPLFGRKTQAFLNKRLGTKQEILRKILKKAGKVEQPKKIGKFSEKTLLDRITLRVFKKKYVVVGGGKALNVQVPFFRRRFTSDLDAKVIGRNARQILTRIALQTNRALKEPGRYVVQDSKHKGTFKLIDVRTGTILIELTNSARRIPFVINPQGIRVETKLSLLFGKADSLSKAQRFRRKGKVDLKDVSRLTAGKVKAKDILPRKRNPSNVFEVVRQPKGMGKARIAFDETHMFFDFEVPLGYSNGKVYTIIRFPITKINRFPSHFQPRIKRASGGLLSQKQMNVLRRDLNTYIKRNKNKFFISPRTASAIVGEREIVIAEGSKFIRFDTYKTFDNDLQKFIKVIEVGFKKQNPRSMMAKFISSWKNKPFKTLKLRLTNPDVLLVRRFYRLIEVDIKLKPSIKTRFLNVFRKLLRSKKGQVAISVKIKKKFKRPTRKKKLTKKQIELNRIQKELKALRRRKLTKGQRIRLRRKLIARRREIIKVLRKPLRPRVRKPTHVRKPIRARRPVRVRPRVRKPTRVRKPIRARRPVRVRPRVRKPTRVRKPIRARRPVRVRPRVRKPTRVRKPLIPKRPTKPKPPPKIILLNIPPTINSLRKYNKIDVYVKKRGRKFKYQRINKGYLTPKEALQFARYKLDKTRLASVIFRPSKLKKRQGFNIKTPPHKFRRSKGSRNVPKNAIVEKRRYRMDSAGEKRQISSKVKKKRPKKKKRRKSKK